MNAPAATPNVPAPSTVLDPEALDLEGLLAELRELRKAVDADLGEADLAHLRKIERIGWAATAVGLATGWIAPNPLSMAALSLGRSTGWLLMHHVGHRGYDKVPGVAKRHTSKVFARGSRRFLDWPDWMIPEAWIYEHNVLHHSHTGEEKDPDLLERNTAFLRDAKIPVVAKYGAMAFLALTWRFFYYAPNTLRTWADRHQAERSDADATGGRGHERALWLRCYLPYAALEFVALPALFLPFGPWAAGSMLANSLGAEAITNVHTFCVVGPNHTGDDLFRFDGRAKTKGEAMLRQIIGSANYRTGGDLVDYAHLWLNYQIEHHIWPDLPMLRYRELAPKVRALCTKYGIPYVQESVWTRVKKMLEVSVGKASMKRLDPTSRTGSRERQARTTSIHGQVTELASA
ncbi:MAG: fatty acid desaturase [Polyangiaceae bacterium]